MMSDDFGCFLFNYQYNFTITNKHTYIKNRYRTLQYLMIIYKYTTLSDIYCTRYQLSNKMRWMKYYLIYSFIYYGLKFDSRILVLSKRWVGSCYRYSWIWSTNVLISTARNRRISNVIFFYLFYILQQCRNNKIRNIQSSSLLTDFLKVYVKAILEKKTCKYIFRHYICHVFVYSIKIHARN